MPNQVYNKLKFSYVGEEEPSQIINQIKELLYDDEKGITFQVIAPEPETSDQEAIIFSINDWRYKNWGVSRDAYDGQISLIREDKIVFEFVTAWNMPLPIIEYLLARFPQCDIHYIAAGEGGYHGLHIHRLYTGERKDIDLDRPIEVHTGLLEALSN